MSTEYWIWVEGTESGPFTFEQLFEAYKANQLPAGFLWRRGDVEGFSPPAEIDWEHARLHPQQAPPVAATPKPRRKFADHRLGAGTAVFIAIAVMAALGSPISGPAFAGGVFVIATLFLVLSICSKLLASLHDIRDLLDESNELQRWRGGDNQ